MDDMGDELLSTEIFGAAVPKGVTVTVGNVMTEESAEHVVHHLTQVSVASTCAAPAHCHLP